jgi:hypothetical protein
MKQAEDTDMTKGFVSKAGLHIVNEESLRDVEAKVLAKYEKPEDKEKIHIDSHTFRANFILDTKGRPYLEDQM